MGFDTWKNGLIVPRGTRKEVFSLTDWLESIFTIFSRIGDFLENAYNAIGAGVSYVSSSVSSVLSVSLPSEILGILALVVAVCVILLILGR